MLTPEEIGERLRMAADPAARRYVRTAHGGDLQPCGHGTPPGKPCEPCRLEGLTTAELLDEVEAYVETLRRAGITPRGWWAELAHRLRDVVTHNPTGGKP